MPSGAKKRKAARRKQQAMGTPNPLPDSQSNPTSPQGNGGIHDHDQIGQSESSDHHHTTDEEAEEEKQQGPPGSAVVVSRESSDNGKLEVEAEVERTDLAIQTKEEPSVQEGEATEVGSEEPVAEALVIPVVQSDSVNEEVAQASETIADSFEIGGDALSHQHEVKAAPAPLVDATIEKPCNFEGSRTPVTTEVTAAPLVAHRATWWNCCGLLDVITGPQR